MICRLIMPWHALRADDYMQSARVDAWRDRTPDKYTGLTPCEVFIRYGEPLPSMRIMRPQAEVAI